MADYIEINTWKQAEKTMWDKIVEFVDNPNLTTSDFQDEDNVRVAITALLIQMAKSDNSFHRDEYSQMIEIMHGSFGFSKEQAESFINRAHRIQSESIDLYRFTKVITKNFSQEDRLEVVRMIWKVVLADGIIDDAEDSLLRKLCHLIGVSQHDSIAIKQELME